MRPIQERITQRIGVKLFMLLSALVVLATIPFAYMVFATLTEFGTRADTSNHQEATRRAHAYLTSITREKAHRYDSFFFQVESAVSLMAAQTQEVYNNIEHYALSPSGVHEEYRQLRWGMPIYRPREVSTVFRAQALQGEEQRLELMALLSLDPVLIGAQENIEASVSTHLISASGICRYFRRSLQSAETTSIKARNPLQYPEIDEVVAEFAKGNWTIGHPGVWTRVYQDMESGGWLLTALAPVIDRQGVFRGSVGMDVSLAGRYDQFYQEVQGEVGWNGDSLFTFLLGANGEIITFPREHAELFGLPVPPPPGSKADHLVLLSESRQSSVAEAASQLVGSVGEIVELAIDGEGYILSSHTLHKLGWHLVQVSSQARLSIPVDATRQALSGTKMTLLRQFVFHGVLSLLATIVVVYFAVQYFVRPLNKMAENAERVGQGDLTVRCRIQREDELGILARSFNTMVTRLQAAEEGTRLEARRLEETVRGRTRDLRNKNIVLRDVIEELRQTETELRDSQSRLENSLAEKEILLREIYHRTKNNMLVIISMLQLQAMEVGDDRVKSLFWETENRIRAMSLVHEKLYQSQNLADIELGQYLKEMVTSLVGSMVLRDTVAVECDCEEVRLSIDAALPLGLAINEIVTNSLKHAFADGRKGRIFVQLSRRSGGEIVLVVGDDGPGLPAEINPGTAHSLGMQITANLINGQLRGKMEIVDGPGVVYRLTFAELARPRRV